MASFVHNNWKGHFGISVSELCFKNALGLLINNRSNFQGGANYRLKNRSDFSRGANLHAKIQDESLSKANHRSKNRTDQNNRCHKNAGKFHPNIVSSEISSKSHEKPGISPKFVCITFAQYCTMKKSASQIALTSWRQTSSKSSTVAQ